MARNLQHVLSGW